MKTSIAIYPGSFDPVTNGHLDLIERGEKMFDLLIVAVLRNAEKAPLFSVPERVEMLREVTRQWSAVEVDVFDGLLVNYARKRGAGVILRGIRAISDYEYELQMALMNRKLEPRLETVFMLPGEPYSYLTGRCRGWCHRRLRSGCEQRCHREFFGNDRATRAGKMPLRLRTSWRYRRTRATYGTHQSHSDFAYGGGDR